jgi:hypothetical protein
VICSSFLALGASSCDAVEAAGLLAISLRSMSRWKLGDGSSFVNELKESSSCWDRKRR